MTRDSTSVQAHLDNSWLSLDELCQLAAVTPQWVQVHIEEGLLGGLAGEPQAWRFDAVALARVRRLVVVERGFDATPELAALVADLEDEINRLRTQLWCAGLT
jgi:chaperone modulatory protein CbpM